MHEKRYSVFISSTFEDLKDERRAIQDVVISSGDFPVQMESFPAADEDQFEFIKALIDKCDYYILVIGGRYGTPADDGISYTEKEYRYAVSVGVPVLVMLHGDPGSIPASKSEVSPDGRERLAKFIASVQKNRLRRAWNSRDDLKLAVREALDNAKLTKPRVGWVRGDAVASVDALEELNEVRKENTKYRDLIGSLEIEVSMPPIPSAYDVIEFDLLPTSVQYGYEKISGTHARLQGSWIGIFPVFYNNLVWRTSDWGGEIKYYVEKDDSCDKIGGAFAGEVASFDTENLYKISKATYDRLSSYFIEVGLMAPEGEHPFTEAAKRIARRYLIQGGTSKNFAVVKGEVSIVSTTSSTNGDEIPF